MKFYWRYRINTQTLLPEVKRVSVSRETKRFLVLRNGTKEPKSTYAYFDNWHAAKNQLALLMSAQISKLQTNLAMLKSLHELCDDPALRQMYQAVDRISPTLDLSQAEPFFMAAAKRKFAKVYTGRSPRGKSDAGYKS